MADLFELEAGQRAENMYCEDRDRLKATVAEQLVMSVRTVNRYLLVLKAPLAVQTAFERGHLTLTEAGQVAARPDGGAAAGRAVAAVYDRHPDAPSDDVAVRAAAQAAALGQPATAAVKPAFNRLVRALRRDLPHVRAGLGDIEPATLARLRDRRRHPRRVRRAEGAGRVGRVGSGSVAAYISKMGSDTVSRLRRF